MTRVGDVSTIFSSEAIASTATVYSNSIRVGGANVVGIAYQATSSGGLPDLLIQVEQSYSKPTTEGSSDAKYVIPEDMANVETNLTTETWHVKSLSLVPMKYMRFKVTGNAANPADALLNLEIFVQEEV
jgi:hypothetical protein